MHTFIILPKFCVYKQTIVDGVPVTEDVTHAEFDTIDEAAAFIVEQSPPAAPVDADTF